MKISFCFCDTAILPCHIYIAERRGNMLLSFCYTMIGLVLFYMMAVVKKFILSKPPGRCRLILQGVCNTFALSQAACQRRYQCDHRTCRPGDPASSWSPNSTVLHLDIYLCKYTNLKDTAGQSPIQPDFWYSYIEFFVCWRSRLFSTPPSLYPDFF